MIYIKENFRIIQVSLNIGVRDEKPMFLEAPKNVDTGIDCPLAGITFADVSFLPIHNHAKANTRYIVKSQWYLM